VKLITRVAIKAVGHGGVVPRTGFKLKTKKAALRGGFNHLNLLNFFTENSAKTFIHSAVTDFHLVAVLGRAAAGTNKAGIREASRGFAARRSCNGSS
jgi:hypothetical protein